MPNSRLIIMEDEFLTSIDYYDEFNANLLLIFDRSIYRPMCTHMGNVQYSQRLDKLSATLLQCTATL